MQVIDDRRLLIPDVAGNRLFQSYLNMTDNPHVALVFFIPGVRETVRVNGSVEIVDRSALDALQIELEVFEPDENAKVLQGIVVRVEEFHGRSRSPGCGTARSNRGGGSAIPH